MNSITDYAAVDDFSSPGMAGAEQNMTGQAGSKINPRSPVKASKMQKTVLRAAYKHSCISGDDHSSLMMMLLGSRLL